jgi:hypothetical protein
MRYSILMLIFGLSCDFGYRYQHAVFDTLPHTDDTCFIFVLPHFSSISVGRRPIVPRSFEQRCLCQNNPKEKEREDTVQLS